MKTWKDENFIVTDDFNSERTNNYLEKFCASCNLKNLIKQLTYFKELEYPTNIEHILTNHPKSFHSSSAFEAGLSGFP